MIARQTPEVMDVLLAQSVRADAAVARENSEFAVRSRQLAIGGQLLELQGLGGVYSDIFLPLHGEHQAHNAVLALAAVEAFFGAGAERQLDADTVRAGFAAVRSPGGWSGCAAHPPSSSTPPTIRRRRRAGPGADRGFRLPLPGRRGQRVGDKDAGGILAALEPVLIESW